MNWRWVRPVLFNALAAGFLILFGRGLLVSPQWDWSHLLITLAGAGLAALVGNMDAFESFKAGPSGLEAKTRQVIKEAETTLDQLRDIATALGASQIERLAAGGRWGGGGKPAQVDVQRARVLSALERLKVSKAQLEEVRKADVVWVSIDYANAVVEGHLAGIPLGPELSDMQKRWNEYIQPWQESVDRPGPEELKRFLLDFRPLEAWREELLADYRHYIDTGQQRRPQIWAKRGQWKTWTKDKSWPAA